MIRPLSFALLVVLAAAAPARGATPERVSKVASAGEYQAWVEAQAVRRGLRVTAVVRRAGERRRVAVTDRVRRRFERRPQIVVTTRGEIGVHVDDKIVVAYADGRRTVRRYQSIYGLTVDDDRTLRWGTGISFRLVDLPRPATPGSCPRRVGFIAVALSPVIAVTHRVYDLNGAVSGSVVRACTIATGEERIVRTASAASGIGGETIAVAGASDRWVVMNATRDSQGVNPTCTRAIVVRDPAAAVEHVWPPSPCTEIDSVPQRGDALAVTASGAVAWVQARQTGTRLMAMTRSGPRELDALGPSPITDLRAEGDGVAWRRDGVDRTAAL